MLAQIIGIAAAVPMFISYLQKDIKKLLILNFVSVSLFVVHYSLIGAFSGAWLDGITALRALVYYIIKKRGTANSRVWPWVFAALFVGAIVISWEGIRSLLPLVSCLTLTYAFNLKSAAATRRFAWISSVCWLTYNIITVSIGGIITECGNLTSIFWTMLTKDIKAKLKSRKQKTKNDETENEI